MVATTGVNDGFVSSDLNANVPREHDPCSKSDLWRCIEQCRVEQTLLRRDHEKLREEFSTCLKHFDSRQIGRQLEPTRGENLDRVNHMVIACPGQHSEKSRFQSSSEASKVGKESIIDSILDHQGLHAEMKLCNLSVECSNDHDQLAACRFKREVHAALRSKVDTDATNSAALATDTDDVSVDRWSFKHSYWDVAAFLGNRAVFEAPEAIANLMLLIVNIVVQACFVIIVSNIAVSSLSDATIEGYHKWRTNIGHAFQHMDPLTEQSLTDRVCAGDPSLHLSNIQAVQMDDIRGYLNENSPFNGPMMCVLGVLTWSLTVSREFHVLKNMVNACAHLPRGKTVILSEARRLELKSLSTHRFLYILSLALLRASIAGSLLFVGIKYLIVTTSIEEILLNAVALEFVLNVDELMFEALAPNKTRRLIFLLRPLPLSAKRLCGGLDADFMVIMLSVVGIFSVCIPMWLLQEMDSMQRASDELCGGVRDFSYSLTVAQTVAWARNQLDPEEAWQRLQGTTRYKVLRSIIDGEENMIAELLRSPPGLTGPGWSVHGQGRWDIDAFGDEVNTDCRDVIRPGYVGNDMALAGLRDAFGNQSISSCEEVEKHCNDYEISIVRMFCPATCRCHDPSSSLALPYPRTGCPRSCLATSTYRTVLATLPCRDIPKHELVSSSAWMAFIDNYLTATSGWGIFGANFQMMAQIMAEHGCDAVHIVRANVSISEDICVPFNTKSVQVWCPISCACKTLGASDFKQCPTQC